MLPPLNTPIAHNGSPECPVPDRTRVKVTFRNDVGSSIWLTDAFDWSDVTTYTILTRAPADRIAELEAALKWYQDHFCEGMCSDFPDNYGFDCSGCKARATLKGTSYV